MLLVLDQRSTKTAINIFDFGYKGPVIIYDRGGAPEENRIFRENFSRPTQRADEKFRGPLDIAR